ncbi:MAG: hypothetical protein ACRDSL_12755 [Pseudonocardiaceae bacterium]
MAEMTAPEGEQPPSRVLGVTCARDGREHLVADEAMTPHSTGRYPALCGHGVWAAVLACPAGPPCRRCAAVRVTHTASRRPDRCRLLARVLTWLNPAQRSGR